jgi:hypothetical protein
LRRKLRPSGLVRDLRLVQRGSEISRRSRGIPSERIGSRGSPLMYPYVAPTCRENSHAHHTWHPPSRQTPCSKVWGKRLPCGFDSHRPLHFWLPGVSLRCPGTRTSSLPSYQSFGSAQASPHHIHLQERGPKESSRLRSRSVRGVAPMGASPFRFSGSGC